MPGVDNGLGFVAAAVPYSWEAAPGKPIEESATAPLRVPLPPPPGSRGVLKPLAFVEPTFGGFAPETDVAKPAGPHFGEKLFKKLHSKLRKKSKVLAASFSNEITRVLSDHKKRTVDVEHTVQSISNESYEHMRGWSSSSSCDLPGTPQSTDSGSLSSMSSLSSTSTSWESVGCVSTLHHEGSHRNIDMLLAASSSSDDDVNYHLEGSHSGPSESAWHEDAEDEELTEQEWQIVRYASLQRDGSSLMSSLVTQSSLTPVGDSYLFSPIRGRNPE